MRIRKDLIICIVTLVTVLTVFVWQFTQRKGGKGPIYWSAKREGRGIHLNFDESKDSTAAVAALIVHEGLHGDNVVGQYEEVIACAIEAITYGMLLLKHTDNPCQAVSAETPLAARQNMLLLSMLMSGEHSWKPGVLDPSEEKRQFFGFELKRGNFVETVKLMYAGLPDKPTPSQSSLQAVFKDLGWEQKPQLNFDHQTLRWLDVGIDVFSHEEVQKLRQILLPLLLEGLWQEWQKYFDLSKKKKIAFPDVAGWYRGNANGLPDDSSGYTIPYSSFRGTEVTIYVYRGRLHEIPSGIGEPSVKSEFARSKSGITATTDWGLYRKVTEQQNDIVRLGDNPRSPRALHSRFDIVKNDGHKTTSDLYLLTYGNHFVKIRCTRPRQEVSATEDDLMILLSQLGNALRNGG